MDYIEQTYEQKSYAKSDHGGHGIKFTKVPGQKKNGKANAHGKKLSKGME
tara:strand:- start:8497 stop:8646 length:150 start_codon:yes stop_codon:yes gene_type:complete